MTDDDIDKGRAYAQAIAVSIARECGVSDEDILRLGLDPTLPEPPKTAPTQPFHDDWRQE